MRAAAERLAWELEAERGQSALFGARIGSEVDLQDLMPMLGERGLTTVALSAEASQSLMLEVMQGQARFPDADAIILTDALALLPPPARARANRSREAWLSTRRCFLFAERTAGSPEALAELRDLVAVFRDVVDLRPDVGHDDHLWDTGAAASLDLLARHIPTTTRGPTLIIGGRVRYKQRPVPRCPDCGGVLESATVSLRFEHAPAATAVQAVPGYRCACGSEWPDPAAMRLAHAQAFGLRG
jgi:hypothetical protein